MSIEPFKSKAAARRAGYRTLKELGNYSLVPTKNAQPVEIKGEQFYAPESTEPAISVTEGKRRKLKRKPGVLPAGTAGFSTGSGWKTYDLYRLQDFEPVRKRVLKPAVEIDLLLAIWTVNRATKRYRDSATSYYHQNIHGFAGHAKQTKLNLYQLKEVGIRRAYDLGRITCVGIRNDLGCFAGEGYFFHSTFVPGINCSVDEREIFIESKPKSKNEARLKDAVLTLGNLVSETPQLDANQ